MPLANKETVVAAQVQGITFRQASEMSVVLAAPGDVTFVDCSFEVRGFDGFYLSR
jgi:hypothetical protein